MRVAALVMALVLPAFASGETSVLVNGVEIVGYGVFESRTTGERLRGNRLRPGVDTTKSIRFTQFTREIIAELGTSFGIQYVINSSPVGRRLEIRCVITFPEGGLTTPSGRVYEESIDTIRVPIGKKLHYGYGFDEKWELIPGEWTFELYHEHVRLARQSFMVKLPDADADLP